MAAPKGNQYAKGKATGRPSGYKPEYAKRAKKACEAGFTDQELAELFGVSVDTIAAWKEKHKDFLGALKVGKAEADDRVERSLYHRAVGYSFDSEKIFNDKGVILRAKIREHVPPDATAMIFWLKNRRPAEWRDKRDIEHSGTVAISHEEALRELEEIGDKS